MSSVISVFCLIVKWLRSSILAGWWVSTCYHFQWLRQLRLYVDLDTMKQLVCAFIFSQLDYCNAILCVLPHQLSAFYGRCRCCCVCKTWPHQLSVHVCCRLDNTLWISILFCFKCQSHSELKSLEAFNLTKLCYAINTHWSVLVWLQPLY